MNLLMFLSNRCNMSCDYCFLDLNHSPKVLLALEQAEKAAADHIAKFGPRAGFTILGGEPFVHFPRLEAIAQAIRSRSVSAPLSVVTNGTLACPKMLARLDELGAQVSVSVDGTAAAHDRHRRLVGSPDSAFAETAKALEACEKKSLRANMVVSRDTIGTLLSGVESLREQGFGAVSFHLDVLAEWSAEELAALRKALDGFERYYRALEQARPGALKLSHIDSFAETPLSHGYDDVVLGADGRYYPCDGLFTRPYRELDRWVVGDASSGVLWKKREDWQRAAQEYIHARLPRDGHFSCARETYFHALAKGLDADASVRAYADADELLGAALGRLRGLREAHAVRG